MIRAHRNRGSRAARLASAGLACGGERDGDDDRDEAPSAPPRSG